MAATILTVYADAFNTSDLPSRVSLRGHPSPFLFTNSFICYFFLLQSFFYTPTTLNFTGKLDFIAGIFYRLTLIIYLTEFYVLGLPLISKKLT